MFAVMVQKQLSLHLSTNLASGGLAVSLTVGGWGEGRKTVALENLLDAAETTVIKA